MIDITHAQAEYLIRAGQDGRRLPEEQWTALQAHLERCERCRAYRARLGGIEHDLTHVLNERWKTVEMTPTAAVRAVPVIARRKRSHAASKVVSLAALPYLLVVLGLLGWFVWREYTSAQELQRRAAAPPVYTVTPVPTRTSTPGGGQFTELLAFSAQVRGNSDIYLYNPAAQNQTGAGENTNLTNHPASDIYPAWSPDGEWIAFVSDREEKGRYELYVISVAGTRLTRLTNRSDIFWQGPLAWSPDGQYIALTGWRDTSKLKGISGSPDEIDPRADRPFVYLVPVDGSGPRSLAFTRGVLGPLQFSPGANLLAYVGANGEGLLVYDVLSSRYIPVTYAEEGQQQVPGTWGSFDWSPDGRRLAFLADGHPGGVYSEILETGDLFSTSRGYDARQNLPVAREEQERGYRSVSWLPDRARRVLAYLVNDPETSCFTIHLIQAGSQANQLPSTINELCVQGSLEPQQWSRAGDGGVDWLVVNARLADSATDQSYHYAIRIPRVLDPYRPLAYQRLSSADPALLDANPSMPVVRPRRPPAEMPAPVNPRPAAPYDAPDEQTAAPAGLLGDLVFSVIEGTNSRFYAPQPNGSGVREITGPDAFIGKEALRCECPAWSPDGQRLAYLSDQDSAVEGAMELFILDGAASADPADDRLRRLTDRLSSVSPLQDTYSCPVWSPDGTRLAAVLRTRGGARLEIFSTGEEETAPLQVEIEEPSRITPLAWTPDGRSVLLISPSVQDTPLRIYTVHAGIEHPRPRLLLEHEDLDEVYGLAFSPDGTRLAFVGGEYGSDWIVRLRLFTMRPDGSGLEGTALLPEPGFTGWVGEPGLAWLPNGSLFYPIRQRAHDRLKTDLWMIDPTGKTAPQKFASLEDLLLESAWSKDGRWLAYTSDAGLFLLDAESAANSYPPTAPLLLVDALVSELDLRSP